MNRPDSETLDVDRGAFGPLLRRFRLAANMSQEELAERARLSVESVSALERGRRRAPYRETIRMLADALRLADSQREELIVAARRSKSGGTLTFDGAAPGSDAALVSNLPIPTTTLIGRDRECGALRTLVTKSRLVTIVGAGGMGKTRLAIDVARHVSDEDRIESRFVDLSPMRDASLVAIHVNAAIGGAAGSPQSAIDAIVKRIGVARMLLVIDNCEHVIDDIARVCDVILSACPNLRILTTSREPLQISGETAFRLASLDVPAAGSLTPDHVRALSSVQLFLERVHACNPELQLSDDLMIDVGAICRRLDGIPLAIELAAAQAQILSVPEFRHQLNETFNVLTAGKRSALPRQQTLHALIAWSFDLLSEIERTLLLRMSVFAGGCTLDAVIHVCTSSDVHTSDAVRTLTMLVQKSLVITEVKGDLTRFRLFESTREFAWNHLDDEERERLNYRHALWIAEVAQSVDETPASSNMRHRLNALMTESDNIRVALSNMLGPTGLARLASQIIVGANNIWYEGGRRTEGSHWIDAAISRIDSSFDATLVGKLWYTQAVFSSGKYVVRACEKALAFFEPEANPTELAKTHILLGMGLWQVGKSEDALAATEKVFEYAVACGSEKTRLYAEGLDIRANILRTCGRIDEAREACAESYELFQVLADDFGVARTMGNLAELEFMCGFTERALELLDRAGEMFEELNATSRLATARVNSAAYRLTLGKIDQAYADAIDALSLAQRAQDSPLISIALQHVATVLALEGESKRSAIIMGYVDNWFEHEGYRREPCEQQLYDILRSSLTSHLSLSEIERFAALGITLSEARALDLACAS